MAQAGSILSLLVGASLFGVATRMALPPAAWIGLAALVHAFRSIGTVVPFVSAMNKLAPQNLAERPPSRWVEWLFHSHPAISRRVAAAEAWEGVRARAS